MAFAFLAGQTIVLVAGLALFGQLVVGMFNWPARHQNFVYRTLALIASPVVRLVRLVTPKVVLDQHIPVAAFMLLFFAYFWLGFEHRDSCRANVAQAACEKWAAAWTAGAKR